MTELLTAGAAAVDMTPRDSLHLYGYPHVARDSTGVHDPLLSSALYLSDGATAAMFIANDIIYVPKPIAASARRRIEQATGVPAANIMVTATHTHSGPVTMDYISHEADPIVPKADLKYVRFMEDSIVGGAVEAFRAAEPAQIGLAVADARGIGTNRRDPSGPADLSVPVLMLRSADGRTDIAVMLVCSMHPTVLHEDSTLITGDFPAMARQYLQSTVLAPNCPVLHHTGPAGNQSPRHVTSANTFPEAERIGKLLGTAVQQAIETIRFTSDVSIECCGRCVDLPRRALVSVPEAEEKLNKAVRRLKELRESGAPHSTIRTAECDWFGAEETLTLAQASRDGRLDACHATSLPAEVQVIRIGPWTFVGWQGEIFIEYALAVKDRLENTFVISLANGELQGYIVTPEAAAEGGYEASNSLFGPGTGQVLVDATLEILANDGR